MLEISNKLIYNLMSGLDIDYFKDVFQFQQSFFPTLVVLSSSKFITLKIKSILMVFFFVILLLLPFYNQ